jgi:PHD/YefM family antitoxin component YafN of YafNO toxin-antitoxin module
MITVSSTEFSRNFAKYKEVSQREPVGVLLHGRLSGVLISSRDYEEYLNLKKKYGDKLDPRLRGDDL